MLCACSPEADYTCSLLGQFLDIYNQHHPAATEAALSVSVPRTRTRALRLLVRWLRLLWKGFRVLKGNRKKKVHRAEAVY